MAVGFSDDLTGWFVRRVGLARVTTFACALGLSLAAIFGARPWVGIGGLTWGLLAALGGLCLSHRHTRKGTRPSVVVVAAVVSIGLFAGYLGGSVRVAALAGSQLMQSVGSTMRGELTVAGQVRSGAGWQSAIAVIREARPEPLGLGAGAAEGASGRGEKVLLELAPPRGGSSVSLRQGQILSFMGKIRLPDAPSASGFDETAYLRSQGVMVVLQVDNAGIQVLGQRGGISGWFDRLRSSALAHLSRGPDPRLDEVLQGVVVGETGGIDKSWSEAFRRSGTAHMFSVSGLHVASLAAIMIGLAGLARAPRGVGFLLAAAAALLLIPFVGASPPVVRAAVMIVVVLAGRWLGRGRDQWQVLALAASVVLISNPFAIGEVGFQLSFAAFAGMLALNGPLRTMLGRLPDTLSSGLAVSIAATVGTAPVSLFVFDRTSMVSPLTNLLVVPVLPAITGLGMASVFLGFLWTGFSTALDLMVSIPVTWTVLVSRLFAVAPVLGVQDVGRVLTAIAFGALTMPVVLSLCGRNVAIPFGFSPPFLRSFLRWVRIRGPRDHRVAAVLGMCLLVAATLLGGALYPWLSRGVDAAKVLASGTGWPKGTEVRILDVGQGNSVLVRTAGHHSLLFDGGPAGCDLASQLRGLGIGRVDLAVISHPHADHFAGLLEAADELEVGTFIDQTMVVASSDSTPATSTPAATYGRGEAADYLELRARLAEGDCRYARGVTGARMEIDEVVVRFFAPTQPLSMEAGPEPWPSGPPTGDELNGSSLVAVVSIGSIDILVPGDAEADVLDNYDLPPVEIVLVPHHGSLGSVSDRLVDRLEPRVACISVGEDNSFGHPNASTVALLSERVGRVLRTDESGWVSFVVSDEQVLLTTERSPGSERGRQGG